MSPFHRVHTTSYSTLIETMHLTCTILEFKRVICRKSPILTYPPAFGALVLISPRSLVSENWRLWDIVWYCLRYSTFSRCDTIPAFDGQTVGHTMTANTALV